MEAKIKLIDKPVMSEILPLYEDAGWVSYTKNPERLKAALEGSLTVLGAYIDSSLIGLIRCVGDGHSIIYVQDILVLNKYQRQGIGSLLLKSLLDKYKYVYQTVLLTDTGANTEGFYTKCGLKRSDCFNCSAYIRYNI
jgi:GNAT superfamily N-acetyltransferase